MFTDKSLGKKPRYAIYTYDGASFKVYQPELNPLVTWFTKGIPASMDVDFIVPSPKSRTLGYAVGFIPSVSPEDREAKGQLDTSLEAYPRDNATLTLYP